MLLLGAAPADWHGRFQAVSSYPFGQRFAMVLAEPASGAEIVAAGFLGFYASMALVHDLSWPGNFTRPEMMSSRYFEFVYPLLILLSFRRVQALIATPGRNTALAVIAIAIAAAFAVAWGWATFGARAVFDVGTHLTRVQGVHTTTYSLWHSPLYLAVWIFVPLVAGTLIARCVRRGEPRRIVPVWFSCIVVLWAGSAYAWWGTGRKLLPLSDNETRVARDVGTALFGNPSRQKAIVLYNLPGLINWPLAGQDGVLNLYASFFSGLRYKFEFFPSEFYLGSKLMAEDTELFEVKRWDDASCPGAVGLNLPATFKLCRCSATGSAELPRCDVVSTPIANRYPGTLFAFSINEQPNAPDFPKPEFSSSWALGPMGAVMHAAMAEVALPLSASPAQSVYWLRLRLTSLGHQRIRVAIDGTTLGESLITDIFPGGWHSFRVPAELVVGKQKAVLTISSENAVRVGDIEQGVAVLELVLGAE
jgi:hypothetical protein